MVLLRHLLTQEDTRARQDTLDQEGLQFQFRRATRHLDLSLGQGANLLGFGMRLSPEALVRKGSAAVGPTIERLTEALDAGDVVTARFAAKTLGLIGDGTIAPVLRELLASEDRFVVAEIALALGRLRDREAVPRLLEMLAIEDRNVRFAVVSALGQIADARAHAALQECLRDEDEGVRAQARWALARIRRRHPPEAPAPCPPAPEDGDRTESSSVP